MEKELKEKWLKALETYPKTKHVLARKGKKRGTISGFCCLGVLAHIASDEPWEEDSKEGCYLFLGDPALLDDDFLKKVGLGNGEASDLMDINDTTKTFKKVIEYIKKNV